MWGKLHSKSLINQAFDLDNYFFLLRYTTTPDPAIPLRQIRILQITTRIATRVPPIRPPTRVQITIRLLPVPVKHEVLHQKRDVKQDGERAQKELGEVAREARPVAQGGAVGEQLRDRERTAGDVEDDVPDVPAGRAPGARRVVSGTWCRR